MVPPNPKYPPTSQSLGRGCGHCAARFGSTDPTRPVPSQLTARSTSTHSQLSSCDPLCLQLPSCPNPGCRAQSSPWPRQPLAAPHTHPALLSSQHTAASPKHPWHPDMAPSSAVLVGLVFFLFGLDNKDVPPKVKIKRGTGHLIRVTQWLSLVRLQTFNTSLYILCSYLIKLLIILFCCWKDQVPNIRNHWNAMYHWNAGFDPATV